MIAATMFSGIGAPECAAPGWDWRWHAEIESFPKSVMKHRHPHSVNLGDVNAEDFCDRAFQHGRPDVVIFGSPCQDYSVAGSRLGLDGPRGNMALVGLGVIRRLRPRWFLFENVFGLLSSFSGSADAAGTLESRIADEGGRCLGESTDCSEDSDFAAFLSAVRECGYLGCYRVLDAQYAGVPQRRRRVFFVGYLGDWRPAVAVLFDPESLRGNPPPSRAPGQRIAPTIDARTDGGGTGWGTDFMSDGGLAADDEVLNPDIAWALQERDHKGADSDTKDGHLIVRTSCRRGAAAGAISDMRPCIALPAAVRRLTPIECERLQNFEDNYTLVPHRGKPAADGNRYKALGNAMNVAELKWILGRIERFEQEVGK